MLRVLGVILAPWVWWASGVLITENSSLPPWSRGPFPGSEDPDGEFGVIQSGMVAFPMSNGLVAFNRLRCLLSPVSLLEFLLMDTTDVHSAVILDDLHEEETRPWRYAQVCLMIG